MIAFHVDVNSDTFFAQTALQQQKALAEDPTVFDYDGVYDDLKKDEQKKVETQRQAKAERKVCLDRGFANPVSSVVVFASLNTFKSSSRKRSSESTSKIASGSGS